MMIRLVQQQDASQLSVFCARVFTETYGHKIPQEVLQRFLQQTFSPQAIALELDKSTIFVAEKDIEIVGFIKLSMYARDTLELDKLYIHVDYQGKGVAQALLETGLEWAKTQSYKTMRLVVWKENKRAVNFYKKHGFYICGQQDVYVDTIKFDDHVMQKEIL